MDLFYFSLLLKAVVDRVFGLVAVLPVSSIGLGDVCSQILFFLEKSICRSGICKNGSLICRVLSAVRV